MSGDLTETRAGVAPGHHDACRAPKKLGRERREMVPHVGGFRDGMS